MKFLRALIRSALIVGLLFAGALDSPFAGTTQKNNNQPQNNTQNSGKIQQNQSYKNASQNPASNNKNKVKISKSEINRSSDKISNGHALEKHVYNNQIGNKPFHDIGVNNQKSFRNHINNVMERPSESKNLNGLRSAFWHQQSGTVVIRNLDASDHGTAFRPPDGKDYFDRLR